VNGATLSELRANLKRRLDGLESRLLELERHPNANDSVKQEIASLRSAISKTRWLIELGPLLGGLS
jgi:uncharacterized protein YigA (DUF484 family)